MDNGDNGVMPIEAPKTALLPKSYSSLVVLKTPSWFQSIQTFV